MSSNTPMKRGPLGHCLSVLILTLAALPASAAAATITGAVRFSGQPPEPRLLNMARDAACASMHSEPVYSEFVVTNSDGMLANVFVYVKKGLEEGKKFPVPAEPVTLDQRGCIYKPHVVGIQTGQRLRVLTSDNTSHNVHPLPQSNREWNLSQAPGAGPLIKTFNRPEIRIPVVCNQHSWMRAYIHVVAHPFFAVTSEDGSFELEGLPPGDYEIEAVHERFGAQTRQVAVEADKPAAVDFTYGEK